LRFRYTFICQNKLKWIGHVKRMDGKKKVSQVFSNYPQESRLRGRPENRWWSCVQTVVNGNRIKKWKKRSKKELTGRSPFRS
jgi:hypothetical protein